MEKVTLPKTTEEKPFIRFALDSDNKLHLSITSSWWGGIESGFYSSEGLRGNTCPPEEFYDYYKRFLEVELEEAEKELNEAQSKLEAIKESHKKLTS